MKNISLEGTVLFADCRDDNGDYKRDSLDIAGIVVNVNGELKWSRGSNDGQPGIRKRQLCGSILYAECKHPNGHWVASERDLSERIENSNGTLVLLVTQVDYTDDSDSLFV